VATRKSTTYKKRTNMIIEFQGMCENSLKEAIELLKKNTKKFVFQEKECEKLYVSKSNSKYHKSRGISVYFSCKNFVYRISCHWSKSDFLKSKKMNCSFVGEHIFCLNGGQVVQTNYNSGGKYPIKLAGGYTDKINYENLLEKIKQKKQEESE
jgi:hypothetical protein